MAWLNRLRKPGERRLGILSTSFNVIWIGVLALIDSRLECTGSDASRFLRPAPRLFPPCCGIANESCLGMRICSLVERNFQSMSQSKYVTSDVVRRIKTNSTTIVYRPAVPDPARVGEDAHTKSSPTDGKFARTQISRSRHATCSKPFDTRAPDQQIEPRHPS